MVHTRWGIGQLRAAEVRRGCIFAEELSSVSSVLKNGGVIGSGAKFVSPTEGFKFSGADGARISYGDVLRNPMSAGTFMAWFRCGSTPVGSKISILGQQYGQSYGLFISTGNDLTFYRASTNINAATPGAAYRDDKWHQVVGTWASGVATKLYVDGVLKNTGTTHTGTVAPFAFDTQLTIGADYNGSSRSAEFVGNIRGCMIFNTALDADEIAAYYNGVAFQYTRNIELPMRIQDHDITNVRSLDRSGNINNARFGDGSTATTYPSKRSLGAGYTFDGTTDYMETVGSVSFTRCTFAAMVRFDANSLKTVLSHGTGGDLFILGAGVQGGTGTNNALYFSMFSTSWKLAGSGVVPLVGKIYSLVGTFDGATLRLYIDGKLDGTNTAAPDTRPFPIRVGRRFDVANPNYLDGDVFGVMVTDRCLTAMQVLDWGIRAKECLSKC